MTSRKSLANNQARKYDLKHSFKTLAFPSVVSFIYALSLFVIRVVSYLDNFIVYVYDFNNKVDVAKTIEYLSSQFAIVLTRYALWSDAIFESVGAICIGVMFAFVAFAFLMKKNRINMYLSSPVDRRTIFSNRVIASTALMAITAAVPIIIDVIINLIIFKNPLYIIWHGFLLFAEYFVYMLIGFAFMSIAMLACNTIIESLFFGAGILWLPSVVILFVTAICSFFLRGCSLEGSFDSVAMGSNNVISRVNLFSVLSILNPLLFGKAFGDYYIGYNMLAFVYRKLSNAESSMDEFAGSFSFYTEETLGYDAKWAQLDIIAPIIIWAVVCVCFLFIARKLFLKRKAENAGIHATSNVPTIIFTAELSLLACVAELVVFYDILTCKATMFRFLLFIIGLAGFVVAYYSVSLISNRKIKLSKKTHIAALSSVGIICVSVIICATGGFGYTSYVPDADEVKYAAIKGAFVDTSGSENNINYRYNNEVVESYDLFQNYNRGSICICESKKDIAKVIELNKALSKETKNMTGASVNVCYVLKNGKTVQRSFYTTDFDAYAKVFSLTDTQAYNNELKSLMLGEGESISSERTDQEDYYYFAAAIGVFEDASESEANYLYTKGETKLIFSDQKTELAIENTTALREALYKDKVSADYTAQFRPQGKPIGEILFYDELCYQEYLREMEGEGLETEEEAAVYYYDDEEIVEDYGTDYYMTYKIIRMYIDESMVNTVEYLKSIGAYSEYQSIKTPEIESVKLCSVKAVKQAFNDENFFVDMGNIFSSCYIRSENIDKENGDFTDSFANAMPENSEIITDSAKVKELYESSHSFCFIYPDDIYAVFTLSDGSQVNRVIYK